MVLFLLVASVSTLATAASELSIENGWVRLVPPVSENTAAYFELKNNSKRDRVLVKVSTEAAKFTEMHIVTGAHGMTAMKPVEAFSVHPGRSLSFEPGGRHVMLIGLVSPLKEGAKVTLHLEFADGEKMDVPLTVKRDEEPEDSQHHHQH